jgi:hypothetical protein
LGFDAKIPDFYSASACEAVKEKPAQVQHPGRPPHAMDLASHKAQMIDARSLHVPRPFDTKISRSFAGGSIHARSTCVHFVIAALGAQVADGTLMFYRPRLPGRLAEKH